MVVKKKTAKVETVALDSTTLEKLTASLSVDGNVGAQRLSQNLLECLRLTDPVLQIQQVKKVGSLIEELRDESCPPDQLLVSCLDTLAVMYASLHAKNPLKRAIASTLGSVPGWLQGQAVSCLSACLSNCLSTSDSDRYPHLTDTVTSCLDGFPLGEMCVHSLLSEVLQFFQKALCEYLQQNSGLAGRHVVQAQVMHACLAVVKASMLVVQRSQELIGAALLADPAPIQDTLNGLLVCYTRILTDEEFVQTVQSTAGMAVILLTRCILGNGDKVAEVVSGLLLGPEQGADSAPVWLKESCAGLYTRDRPPAVSLFLCHGTLAMLNWRGGALGLQGERLLLLVPAALLSLDTSVKESSTAMVVARVLMLWSSAALDSLQGEHSSACLRKALLGGAELPGRLQEHIQAHWEHPLDGVRHQTRALFRNLLRLHQACVDTPGPTSDPFVTELTRRLLGLEWHARGKYAALGCLVEHLGADHLLSLDPSLPACLLSLMGDQTLAPHAGDLLEKLFISHKAQLMGQDGAVPDPGPSPAWIEEWNRTWVTPLLDVLCRARLDQTNHILDYFLPKLLRCCPSSLGHMVQVLQNAQLGPAGSPGSRGALGALMTCLRAARAHGVEHPSEEGLWGGLVPLSLLRQALVHKHDQVRMDALGLVCESHRSTETLSREEIDLIRHFLPCSLNSQSPGIRQETVSLLKKLLCRVKDSAQLLQKKLGQERGMEQGEREGDRGTLEMYQEFLRWFCEILFQALLPGASFPTCLTTLHVLGLVADLFTFSPGPGGFALGDLVSHAHAQAVLYCLASNFLEVKQLASALLRKLPPLTVGLQVPDKMRSLLRVALDLSTSTKPFDSVTAAHLLSLLAHQEGMLEALAHCAQEQGLAFQPPAPGDLQASQAFTLERNTLGVVQFLLLCVKAEVVRAEASLLQAAASCPLYGRAHCITAALQQLRMGSLALTTQWRCVVTDLIATSYRMSDVVSPVVQSSSPEGLIPMDTDSETSAGLQQILLEIQPRDTNDFFTDARELETQAGAQTGHTSQSKSTGGGGEGYRVTAQMVLVCCWRSMKEVSMLLGQVCQDMPLRTGDAQENGIITEEQVEGVGQYFRQQLLQSRHRGAFELAYVGFVRLTEMLCRSGSQTLQQLPSHWLKEVLGEVKSSDPSSKLCATRRSAGIPFYIQALLSSEPKGSSCSLLKMTMKELTGLAMPDPNAPTDCSTVPQVHALNILRALYRDTRLGENIVPFVSDGVQAAVLGFTSPVWAVRNSSTLLFSTLITRIFGVKKGKDEHSKKNRMTGREFFTRFPALYPFLLGQLEEAAGSVDSDSGEVKLHPSLFLLLLILGRLYPSPMDGSSSPLGLAPFMPFIIRCGRSAVYRTREMAARALVPFVLVTQVPSTVRGLLEALPLEPGPGTQQNHIHGTLLQVLHLLRSYQTDTHRPHSGLIGQDCDIIAAVRRRLWLATRRNPCLVTRAAFLDLLMNLCGSPSGPAKEPDLAALREETLQILTDSELLDPDGPGAATGPGATQYLQSLARVAASASTENPELWGAGPRGPLILGRLLQCPQYEVRQLALEVALRRLEGEGRWPGDLGPTRCTFTSMALHERHPRCLTKVLQVLSRLSLTSVLPWGDGARTLTDEEALDWLLTLTEGSAHSVELHCAALILVSRLTVHLVETAPQGTGVAAVSILRRWGALVSRCCSEDQPGEVKLTAAEVLVRATPSLLAGPTLTLSLGDTVALWRSLFALLQDEDHEVRDRASDFTTTIPGQLFHGKNTDVAPVSVSPPVALDLGVGLLCRLFQAWGQVPAGILKLTEWLMGEGEPETGTEEIPSLEEEEFLFEKGELNLWAEPLQWVRLLHRHLSALLRAPGVAGVSRAEVDRLTGLAGGHAHAAQRTARTLPPLPQFSCTADHARADVKRERAELALELLGSLRAAAPPS